MSEIFISYSREDEKWRERIVSHLEALPGLKTWYDTRIGPGEEWYPEIETALNTADACILLVTRNFLTSKFILTEEIPRILDRKKQGWLIVVPVIAESCVWRKVPWLSEMAFRPKTGEALSDGSDHQADKELAAIVEELDDRLRVPPYTMIPLGELKHLLFSISSALSKDEKLTGICRQCVPDYVSLPARTRGNWLTCLLDWLAKQGRLSSGKTPILEFVNRLIPFINQPEISGRLREWIRRMAENLGLFPDEITDPEKSKPSDASEKPEPLHLLIRLEQKNPNKSEYMVQAWLFEGESAREVYTEESPLPLDRLPDHVGNILECIDDRLCSVSEELTMEFFLPDPLLNHDIEDLKIEEDDDPIGTDHRVVIRSLNRLQNSPSRKRRWFRYWNKCKDALKNDPRECMFRVDESEKSFPRSRLEEGTVFFILNSLPEQGTLIRLIRSGVPIALWPRQKNSEDKLSVSCQTLDELPEFIRKKRLRIWESNGEEHTGHVSLLWDDPKRVPLLEKKKKKLGAPGQ